MMEFISQHQFGIAAVVYWIYSAAVSALPDPAPRGSPAYLWLYRFSHTIAGNITTALGSRIPGLKILGLVVWFRCCWFRQRRVRRTTRFILVR